MSIATNKEFIALRLSGCPLAQLRTHAVRVFTFYVGGTYNGHFYENATNVVKGPYVSDMQRIRYFNVQNKAKIFLYLAEIGKPTLLICPTEIKNNWIDFPNVNPHPQKVILEKDRFLNEDIPTVDRSEDKNFLKLTQFLAGRVNINETFVGQIMGFALLYTYVMMYLLKVGDIGLSNTLVDVINQRVYVVDFDEPTEMAERSGRYFFLRGNPAKAYAFDQLVAKHIVEVLSLLQSLVRNPQFVGGVNTCMGPDYNFITAVHDFAGKIYEVYPEISTGVKKVFPIVLIPREKEEEVCDCPINILATTVPKEPLPLHEREIIPMAKSHFLFSGISPNTSMSMTGMFHSAIAPSGNKISLISSLLQKSIRRNALTNALIAMTEMYSFFRVEKGKAVVTNLINRLCIIAVEDIGPANAPLVMDVLFKLNEARTSISFESLISITAALAESSHSRFCSHLFRTYSNLEKMQDYARLLQKPDLPIIVPNNYQIVEVTAENSMTLTLDGILPPPNHLLTMITYILTNVPVENYLSRYRIISLMAFYFVQASKPVKADKNPMLEPILSMDAVKALLKSFQLPVNVNDLFLSLIKAVTDKNRRALFMFAAIYAIFQFKETKSDLSDYEHFWSTNETNVPFIFRLRENMYQVVIDEVVADIHTGKKKTDASMYQFRTDGAAVANEAAVDIYLKQLYV